MLLELDEFSALSAMINSEDDALSPPPFLEINDLPTKESSTEPASIVQVSGAQTEVFEPELKEGDSTVATVEGSLESSLVEGSILPGSERNQISLLINGTHYVGNISPTVSSRLADVGDFDGVQTAGESGRGETKKEQGRRLLNLHRNSCARTGNLNRIKPRKTVLQSIKEEDCIDSDDSDISGTEEAPMAVARDNTTEDGRRRAIQLILEMKFKTSGSYRRNAVRKLKKPAKISHPANIFRYECWRDVVLTVAYFIPLFSSSAGRYAKFRSNRRFKPGD